jgi:hypothetical protein
MRGEDAVQAEWGMDRYKFCIDRGYGKSAVARWQLAKRRFNKRNQPRRDRTHERLLELLAGLDPHANPARRLADINRVAASDLLH